MCRAFRGCVSKNDRTGLIRRKKQMPHPSRVRELKKGEEIDEEELIAEIRIAGLKMKWYNIRAAKHKS